MKDVHYQLLTLTNHLGETMVLKVSLEMDTDTGIGQVKHTVEYRDRMGKSIDGVDDPFKFIPGIDATLRRLNKMCALAQAPAVKVD